MRGHNGCSDRAVVVATAIVILHRSGQRPCPVDPTTHASGGPIKTAVSRSWDVDTKRGRASRPAIQQRHFQAKPASPGGLRGRSSLVMHTPSPQIKADFSGSRLPKINLRANYPDRKLAENSAGDTQWRNLCAGRTPTQRSNVTRASAPLHAPNHRPLRTEAGCCTSNPRHACISRAGIEATQLSVGRNLCGRPESAGAPPRARGAIAAACPG